LFAAIDVAADCLRRAWPRRGRVAGGPGHRAPGVACAVPVCVGTEALPQP